MKKKFVMIFGGVVILAIIVLIVIVGNNTEKPVSFENTGTNSANIFMGSGKFAGKNGFIYFATPDGIIEYDLESRKSVVITTPLSDPYSLTIADRDIYYSAFGYLNTIRKDGKKYDTIFKHDKYGVSRFYVDDLGAYFINGIEGSVFELDMETMQVTELISKINAYFVDETTLYVIARDENDQWQLYYRGREETQFKMLELSFNPIAIYANEQGLYLAKKESYQITHVANGVETELPCQSVYYQILGNQLIYMDKNTFDNSCFALKSYDMVTGAETVLAEKVYDFGIVEERYVACQLINPIGGKYIIIDTQTGETISVPTEGGK